MKTSIILSTASVLLITFIVFFYAGQQATALTTELAEQRAQFKLWSLLKDKRTLRMTEFSRKFFLPHSPPEAKSLQIGEGSVSHPSGLMTAGIISACNPRIKPCF